MAAEPREREPRRERERTESVERWTMAGPISSMGPAERIEELEMEAAATVANAAPLGLAGFAGATFTVSVINAGWLPSSALIITVPILIVFGGITQFIAGMWAFRKGNTFAATAFGSFGAFNTLFAIMIAMEQGGIISLTTFPGFSITGVVLAMFALIAAYLAWAATRVSGVLVAVLGVLALTYATLSIGFLTGGNNGWIVAGGYLGMIASLLAFYASAAIVLNSSARREMLPF